MPFSSEDSFCAERHVGVLTWFRNCRTVVVVLRCHHAVCPPSTHRRGGPVLHVFLGGYGVRSTLGIGRRYVLRS